jgi:hypothetical protein
MMHQSEEIMKNRQTRKACVEAIRPMFGNEEDEISFAQRTLDYAATQPHIMEFTRMRCLEAFFALIRKGI